MGPALLRVSGGFADGFGGLFVLGALLRVVLLPLCFSSVCCFAPMKGFEVLFRWRGAETSLFTPAHLNCSGFS